MRLAGVPVTSLRREHVASLPENRVGESRTLEFKRTLPGGSLDDKKEFLADVSALANTAGGVILYGIETERDSEGKDTGVASAIPGLPGVNFDKEKQRLSSMLHDGISPSLASHIALQEVEGPIANAPVIALGVSQSLARPHTVAFQRSGKFWRRSDSGKYQPDIEELRAMFREGDSWIAAAQEFRDSRILEVRADDAMVPSLTRAPCLLIHVLPLGRLAQLLDLKGQLENLRSVLPPGSGGWNQAWNGDGYVLTYSADGKSTQAYTQWFRFGGVEGYDSYIVGARETGAGQELKTLFAQAIMGDVRKFVSEGIEAMSSKLSIEPPYVVMLSLIGIAGSHILTPRYVSQPIVKDLLRLPPVVCEDDAPNYNELLAPLFDIVYQSAGFATAPPPVAQNP